MSWSTRILVVLALLAGAFGAGWAAHARKAARDALQDQLAAERGARVLEAQETRRAARNADALTQDRLLSERRATDADERLRQLAATAPATASACASGDAASGPAAWVLRGQDRADLVALAREADAVADRLRACQRDLSDHAPVTHDGGDHL